MLLVVQEPPPTAKRAVPQDWPDLETTSTSCSQAALAPGNGRSAYPAPPWTMCSATPGREASQDGAADIEVARGSNCPSQPGLDPAEATPATKSPLSTRSYNAVGVAPAGKAWNSGPPAPSCPNHCPAQVLAPKRPSDVLHSASTFPLRSTPMSRCPSSPAGNLSGSGRVQRTRPDASMASSSTVAERSSSRPWSSSLDRRAWIIPPVGSLAW